MFGSVVFSCVCNRRDVAFFCQASNTFYNINWHDACRVLAPHFSSLQRGKDCFCIFIQECLYEYPVLTCCSCHCFVADVLPVWWRCFWEGSLSCCQSGDLRLFAFPSLALVLRKGLFPISEGLFRFAGTVAAGGWYGLCWDVKWQNHVVKRRMSSMYGWYNRPSACFWGGVGDVWPDFGISLSRFSFVNIFYFRQCIFMHVVWICCKQAKWGFSQCYFLWEGWWL